MCAVCAAHGKNVDLMVNYPRKDEVRGPGNVSFEVDTTADKVGSGRCCSQCAETDTAPPQLHVVKAVYRA